MMIEVLLMKAKNNSYFQKKTYYLEITTQKEWLFPKENLLIGNNSIKMAKVAKYRF
jgi:hypothetical protein